MIITSFRSLCGRFSKRGRPFQRLLSFCPDLHDFISFASSSELRSSSLASWSWSRSSSSYFHECQCWCLLISYSLPLDYDHHHIFMSANVGASWWLRGVWNEAPNDDNRLFTKTFSRSHHFHRETHLLQHNHHHGYKFYQVHSKIIFNA